MFFDLDIFQSFELDQSFNQILAGIPVLFFTKI